MTEIKIQPDSILLVYDRLLALAVHEMGAVITLVIEHDEALVTEEGRA